VCDVSKRSLADYEFTRWLVYWGSVKTVQAEYEYVVDIRHSLGNLQSRSKVIIRLGRLEDDKIAVAVKQTALLTRDRLIVTRKLPRLSR
jgi:hypothetical protein